MPHTTLQLPSDPESALEALKQASSASVVIVFKKSPICPTSTWAEEQFKEWLDSREDDTELAVAMIDVIAEKPLARGLTKVLGIDHESPQAMLFAGGKLRWHDSHRKLGAADFAREVASA